MSYSNKISYKILSVILAFLTVLYTFPLTVLAIDDNNTPTQTTNYTATENIIELSDKRSATTKTYRLPDGSYYIAQYVSEIHTLDENGTWQDIDNHMGVNGNEISTGDAKIKFAKKTTGNGSIFTLHNHNKKLALSLDGANLPSLTISSFAVQYTGDGITPLSVSEAWDIVSSHSSNS